jgi:hypothetical protein
MKTSAGKIDWQVVLERASRWGGQRCVYLMVLLVRELLGAAPPAEIVSAMKPDDYQPAFLDEALEQILDGSPSAQRVGARLGQFAKIQQIRGIRGKALALLRGAFPSRENLARRYPVSASSPKMYLWYLFHLGRLTAYYGVALLRLFRRDPTVIGAVHQAQRVNAVSDWMFP